MLGKPTAWLASFARWPLYTAMTFFTVGMFILGSIHLAVNVREWLERIERRRLSRQNAERDAIMKTMERAVSLYRREPRMNPMQQLSLLELNRSELARFDLVAPEGVDDTRTIMFYQRLLPYSRSTLSQAEEAARSWKGQSDDEG